ncbi:type II toxin-antitoxin system RelE/ParE family toxin [Frigidibacter oleivorans]|uniref:type II toxin-antitoxin system RelE/ParE family toxin n=1 Tax=Frigidibacter oleivorans TaxID=2487129 RepID=UPI000F8D4DCC|nr:type II toxin-antitoxin system RelE/ParE family toxin [Frigidibacter oleivorans]
MPDYRLSRAAAADLRDIWLTGEQRWGRAVAGAYYDRLIAAMELIAANPRMNRLRRDVAHGLRLHPCGAHVILYRDEPVSVLRILHHRQHLLQALEE